MFIKLILSYHLSIHSIIIVICSISLYLVGLDTGTLMLLLEIGVKYYFLSMHPFMRRFVRNLLVRILDPIRICYHLEVLLCFLRSCQ
jgi:hypothetical protein